MSKEESRACSVVCPSRPSLSVGDGRAATLLAWRTAGWQTRGGLDSSFELAHKRTACETMGFVLD